MTRLRSVNTVDLMARTGLTVRVINYWAGLNLFERDMNPGTGNPREWTEREIRVVRTLILARNFGIVGGDELRALAAAVYKALRRGDSWVMTVEEGGWAPVRTEDPEVIGLTTHVAAVVLPIPSAWGE